MTKREIILETVEYYKNNPRGYDGDSCFYFKNGIMCAVGRCMNTPEKFVDNNDDSVSKLFSNNVEDLDLNLKEQYRGHDFSFWRSLQSFHDSRELWLETDSGNNLTEYGESKLENLLINYADS